MDVVSGKRPRARESVDRVARPVVDSLDRLAVALVAATNTAIVEGARGIEPTFVQWRALVVLDDSIGHLRLHELAEGVGISMPSASRLVRRLAARDLVAISRDARDGRGILIALTDLGREVRQTVVARRHELIEAALVGLVVSPDAERSLEELADVLAGSLR